MKCGIKLTVDYAFKRTFGTEENRNVLKHLLNSILARSLTSPIAEITVLNPFSGKVSADDKLSIFDIKARDEIGREFIVEVQLYDHENLRERLVYYWAKEYSGQLQEGDNYDVLKPVFVICIAETTLFRETTKAHSRFQLIDTSQNLTLTSHLEVHVIELQKFSRDLEELEDDEERWLYFLRNAEDYDSESLPQPLAIVPEIIQATGTLTMVAHSPAEREIYEAKLKAQRDERSRIATAINRGLAEGRTEGRLVQARAMLLRLGQRFIGPLTPQEQARVEAINEVELLEEYALRVPSSESWNQLLGDVSASASNN